MEQYLATLLCEVYENGPYHTNIRNYTSDIGITYLLTYLLTC